MRKVTLSFAPGLKTKGPIATIWSDGTVIGGDPIALDYRRRAPSEMDFTLPPDERLLKFVGSPSMLIVSEPTDVGT